MTENESTSPNRRNAVKLIAIVGIILALSIAYLLASSLTESSSALSYSIDAGFRGVATSSGDVVWTTRAGMPTPRYLLGAVAASDGNIYAIGGYYFGTLSTDYTLYGSVTNNTSESIHNVKIMALFWDSNGQLVGTASRYTSVDAMVPGSSSSFDWPIYDLCYVSIAHVAHWEIYAIGEFF